MAHMSQRIFWLDESGFGECIKDARVLNKLSCNTRSQNLHDTVHEYGGNNKIDC